jgi:hypothetical protein
LMLGSWAIAVRVRVLGRLCRVPRTLRMVYLPFVSVRTQTDVRPIVSL